MGGMTIEWQSDHECECCIEDEIPDMCIVWKEIDPKGKEMAECTVIKFSELGDRMDAGFHILRKKNEKAAADFEQKMDRSAAIALAVETLAKVPLKYRRDINPLVRGITNRAPDIQAQERAVREYPYLALAIFAQSSEEISQIYRDEAKHAEATAEMFRKLISENKA